MGFQILQSSSVKPVVEEPFRKGPAGPRGPRLPDWWKPYPVSQGLGEERELPKIVPLSDEGAFLPTALVEKRGVFSVKDSFVRAQ